MVVDRNTVPVALGDVRITFAGSLEAPGKVEYIHPLHNLAVVSYDPALIGDTPVQAATFSSEPVVPGEELEVVGLKADHTLLSQPSLVRGAHTHGTAAVANAALPRVQSRGDRHGQRSGTNSMA